MKKMPYNLKLALFLVVLGIICAGLLAGVNAITAPIIKERKEAEISEVLNQVGLTRDLVDLVKENLLPQQLDGIVGAYKGKKAVGEEFYYVFSVEQTNQFTTFTTMVVFSDVEYLVEDVVVLSTSRITTHGKDAEFIGNNFGLIGSTPKNYGSNFNSVSGATVSSESVKSSIKVAYMQLVEIVKEQK